MDLLLRNVQNVLHEYRVPGYVGDLALQIWNVKVPLLTEIKTFKYGDRT
jgi:phage terminase small subunit